MTEIIQEKMSDEFTKHHVKGFPFDVVFHHFTDVDKGGPHDHPFSFNTHIIKGSYKERIYTVTPEGFWFYEDYLRKEGESHLVKAECIHRIIELPEGECWTVIRPQPKTREWGFWHFDEEKYLFKNGKSKNGR